MRLIGLAVLLILNLILAPLVAEGQQAGKVHRIGILFETTLTASGEDGWRTLFRQRGYIEAQNAVFEFRWAGERFEKLPALADELVRLRVDIT